MTIKEEILNFIKRKLSSDLLGFEAPSDRRIFANINPLALRKAIIYLEQRYKLMHFITLSTVDDGLNLEFLYHFDIKGTILTLRCVKPKEDNTLDSITDLIPAANFIERETMDLFGVKLNNHPQPQNLIMTRDWPSDKLPLKEPMSSGIPSEANMTVESMIATGCIVPFTSSIQKKRVDGGLPKTSSFVFTDDKSMEEFHSIIKETGLDKKAGFDWERKRLRSK